MPRNPDTASWIPTPRAAPLLPGSAVRASALPRLAGRCPSHWDLVSTGRVPAAGWLERRVAPRGVASRALRGDSESAFLY
jgi:hypothetical protein